MKAPVKKPIIRRVASPYYNRILIIALAVSLTSASCVGELERKQAVELRRIASETSPYPASKAAGEKVVLKSNLVSFFNYYETRDDFSKVRDFYDTQLRGKGWTRVETPPSIFVGEASERSYRKGDYTIVVEHDEKRLSRFDVVFKWTPH